MQLEYFDSDVGKFHYGYAQTLVEEVCHKFKLKVLGEMNVYSFWSGNFTLKVNDTGKTPQGKAYALTYNGLVNAVVWALVQDVNGTDKIVYFYSTNRALKSRGDRFSMRSVKLSELMRKIAKEGTPCDDNDILRSSTLTGSLIEAVSKGHELESEYGNISIRGEDFHRLLELALTDKSISENMIMRQKETLDRMDKLQENIRLGMDKAKQDLMNPFVVLAWNEIHGDTGCVCFKAKISSDEGFEIISDMKAYKHISETPYYETISAPLTMRKVMLDDTEKNDRKVLDGAMIVKDNTYRSEQSHYDHDTKIGVAHPNTDISFGVRFLYITNVE